MNAFTWLMANYEDNMSTRYVVLDHVLIEIGMQGIEPRRQRIFVLGSGEHARMTAVDATERLEKFGFKLHDTVRAARIVINHDVLIQECQHDRGVGFLLNQILQNLESAKPTT